MNLDIPDPGDGSNHDLLRLSLQDRAKIMHVLDGLKIISEPRVFRRFFSSKQEARLSKVQPSTHTVFGSSFHDHGPSTIREDEHPITIQFMHLTNPLFNKETNNTNNDCGNRGIDALNENCHHDEAQRSKMREDWLEQLKESIRRINKFRPKFVVASGNDINEKCRKLIAKISETVPVILCDGKQFASFWHKGYVFLSLRGKYLSPHQEPDIDEATSATEVREEDGRSVESRDLGTESCRSIQCHNATFREQMSWVTEQLEQVNMGMRNTMIFVDCDPRQLSPLLIKKFMKNKVFCVIGSSLSPKYSVERKSEEELNEACCLKGSSYAPDEDIDCSSSDGENDEVEKNRKAKKTITLISGSLSIITMEQNSWNEVGLLIDEV